jgi:uncharacterized protein (DUF924 family)
MDDERVQQLLAFWFDQSGPAKWYVRDDAFDQQIVASYEALSISLADEVSLEGQAALEKTSDGALATIIALDQFPRNMYRDDPKTFAWDTLALGTARRAIAKGFDMTLEPTKRMFLYLPFMHSEDLNDQDYCVECVKENIGNEVNIHHACEHRDVIKRFGRFPHRNDVLGRDCTDEELQFLSEGGYTP